MYDNCNQDLSVSDSGEIKNRKIRGKKNWLNEFASNFLHEHSEYQAHRGKFSDGNAPRTQLEEKWARKIKPLLAENAVRISRWRPGTATLCEIRKLQKGTEHPIPK